MDEQKPIVKVCTHGSCLERGSEALFEKLQAELYDEALVLRHPGCFDRCDEGPIVSVAGNLLKGVMLENSVARVRKELSEPSLKSDGAGTKSLSELDSLLDEMTNI